MQGHHCSSCHPCINLYHWGVTLLKREWSIERMVSEYLYEEMLEKTNA